MSPRMLPKLYPTVSHRSLRTALLEPQGNPRATEGGAAPLPRACLACHQDNRAQRSGHRTVTPLLAIRPAPAKPHSNLSAPFMASSGRSATSRKRKRTD
eukprot:4509699-Amphidinium_carterae.1